MIFSGNVMCIYEVKDDRLYLKEQPVYGSSRLGVLQPDQLLPVELREGDESAPASSEKYGRFMGQRRYELADHLGNVHVTVSDRKQEKGVVAERMLYIPEMLSSTDYYPYGLPMPERTFQAGNYRYGFNGQEKDDEVYGAGGSYTAEFWQYDARLGRRWNVDPVIKPWESSYATFAGNPVWFRDISGLDTSFTDDQARKDFLTAYNRVNNTVNQLDAELRNIQNQMNVDDLKKSDRRRLEKNMKSTQEDLGEWNKLKADFTNIIGSGVVFKYTSNTSELRADEYGAILSNGAIIYIDKDGQIVEGEINISIRPGFDDYVIHENRHGNQRLQGTSNRPVLDIEREAFLYQRIYNPSRIANMIENARILEYQDKSRPYSDPNKRPLFYSLDDAIKYIYRDQMK